MLAENSENSNNKKKRSSVSKKHTNRQKLPVSKDSINALPLNKIQQADVDKLLDQAFVRHKFEQLEDIKHKHKDINYLSSIIEEYLSCFVLVGYSIQNEKICIFNAHSSKDEAALVDHLRATFLEIANNRP